MQLEGPSLQTQIARSSDFCSTYYSVFQVPLGGQYMLKIVKLRSDYMATRLTPEFPPIDYQVR